MNAQPRGLSSSLLDVCGLSVCRSFASPEGCYAAFPVLLLEHSFSRSLWVIHPLIYIFFLVLLYCYTAIFYTPSTKHLSPCESWVIFQISAFPILILYWCLIHFFYFDSLIYPCVFSSNLWFLWSWTENMCLIMKIPLCWELQLYHLTFLCGSVICL